MLFSRGGMVVPERGEQRTAERSTKITFLSPPSIFQPRPESKLFLLSDSKENKVFQTFIFTFSLFFVGGVGDVCEVFSKEGEGNYFYMKHLFYLKPL